MVVVCKWFRLAQRMVQCSHTQKQSASPREVGSLKKLNGLEQYLQFWGSASTITHGTLHTLHTGCVEQSSR